MDVDFYRVQAPVAESLENVDDVIRYHRERGRANGLVLHPLLEPEWWRDDAVGDAEIALAAERQIADGSLASATTSPLVADPLAPVGSTRDFLEQVLEGRARVALPEGVSLDLAVAMYVDRVSAVFAAAPNSGQRSGVDWTAVAAAVGRRTAGRVSVLVPTYEDWRMTVDAVRSVLATTDADLEIVILDNGSRPAVSRLLIAVFLFEPAVSIIRSDRNTNFAGGMNRAFAESTGEFVLLLNNDAVVTDGWLDPLLRELQEPDVLGVQPLLLYPHTGRVQAAGTVFLGDGVLPWHFLAGHPVEDALAMRDQCFAAVTAAVLLLRAADFAAAAGFDEGYANGYEDVDLCLRMLNSTRAHFRVATKSVAFHPEGSSPGRADHDTANRIRFLDRWCGLLPVTAGAHYRGVGLSLVAMSPLWYSEDVPVTIIEPQIVRPPRAVESGPAAGRLSLRWALLTGPGAGGDVDRLRAALRELGQEVVTFRAGVRPSDSLDDVVVSLVGSRPPVPRAGAFNVLVGETRTESRWDAVLTVQPDWESLRQELLRILDAAAARGEEWFARG